MVNIVVSLGVRFSGEGKIGGGGGLELTNNSI